MPQDDINTAKKMLEDYIESKKLRNIPKRFDILGFIYSYDDHFNVESLYEHIQKQNCVVSRATLYNTMELFLDAKLITKHQFLPGISIYEKALKKFHHHYVCTKCNRISDLRDEGVVSTAIKTRRIAKFKQTGFSLCIYGICSACSKKES